MNRLPCPYLHGDVELTDERGRHIATHHPDLPEYGHRIAETLAEPDEVRVDADYPNTRLFLRWYDELRAGKLCSCGRGVGPTLRHATLDRNGFRDAQAAERRRRMETPLTFEYDEVGDILYINQVPPYPEQNSEQLAYNIVARRNPRTEAIENLEVLFFTRWLFKGEQRNISGLRELFAEPGRSAHA